MHPLQFNHCSQSQVAAPTCARQLTDGSAQSNCSSRRSATLPITFFLISKIWKGDLRARFCVQLWILMNELCGFSQNRYRTSPALRFEAGTCCLQSQPTWDLCGPPKTTFLKTPSSCGPYNSNLRIIELPNIASNCLGTGCKCWYNQNSHPFSMSSNKIRLECLSLAGLWRRSMRIAIAERKNSQSGSQEIRLEAVPACHIGTLQIRSHILFGDKVSVFHHEAHWSSTKDHQLCKVKLF